MWTHSLISIASTPQVLPVNAAAAGVKATSVATVSTTNFLGLMIDTAHFTPWSSLAGGAMLGAASLLILVVFGQTTGISGITSAVMRGFGEWRLGFVAGLLVSGVGASFLVASAFEAPTAPWWLLGVAGVLVGIGTRYGGGCTSGHGVCGLGRARPRSAAAVPTFIIAGAVTVYAIRVFGGAA